jgi:hypothetical protein
MQPPLRVEVPDEEHAASLRRHLQPFDVETHTVSGHCEVSVVVWNPRSSVVDVLNAVDRWLLTADLPLVTVHLDGSSYTLSAPVTGSADAAAL